MTDEEFRAVIDGRIAGKTIQRRLINHLGLPWQDWWQAGDEPQPWYPGHYNYRVKPEPPKPREWSGWANWYQDILPAIHRTMAQANGSSSPGRIACTRVVVREIVEEAEEKEAEEKP
jgi:hypothetical protein